MNSTIVYYTKKTATSIIHAGWHGFWTAVGLTLIVKIIGVSGMKSFLGIAMYYSLHP